MQLLRRIALQALRRRCSESAGNAGLVALQGSRCFWSGLVGRTGSCEVERAHCRGDGLAAAFLVQQVRGSKINGSEVRAGQILERKGRLVQVLKIQHAQSGRGGATIQVEHRDLQSGTKSSERLRTTEAIERIAVDPRTFTYLYDEGDNAILMDPESFEQIEVNKELFGSGASYLTDGMTVKVQMYDGKAISASVPISLTCKVAQADPFMKGQTAAPSYKRVVLENGKQIMAPQFIVSGDQIVVNTIDDAYVTRASKE